MLVMMKQPAENPNATAEEVEASRARASQFFMILRKLLKKSPLAYKLWRDRGSIEGSPEEDWFRAEKIVRNRLAATLTA
jgi:hypothetical protein